MEYQVKAVVGYEGIYEVDNQGNVFSLNYGRTGERKKRKLIINTKGYLSVNLSKDGKAKKCSVHRLVAEAFLPNPNNLPCINHKDECKTNNLVENLEFCTYKYNLDYSNNWRKSAKARLSPVLQYTMDGEFVTEYPSLTEASRQTGINAGNISSYCNGRKGYSHAGGYKWKYKKED